MQHIPSLYVAPSPLGGRGVFTAAEVPEGALIEISPVLVLKPADCAPIDKTDLFSYYFLWGVKEETCAIALGYGSLYNHSYHPNARYLADYEEDRLLFYSITDIGAGEEITVNYMGSPEEKGRVWFRVKDR